MLVGFDRKTYPFLLAAESINEYFGRRAFEYLGKAKTKEEADKLILKFKNLPYFKNKIFDLSV